MLDLILLVVVAAFAVSGYRQGFIVGILSFFGFVGGALLGAEFGPDISRALVGGQTQQDVIAVVLLVSFAVIGQFIASSIGAAMRSTVTWHSATVLDSVGGSVVSAVSVLLIAWVVGSVLIESPFPVVDTQVNNSLVLQTLDKFMPSPAKTMFSDFRRLLASNSTYAEVFSGIGAERILAIPAPDPSVVDDPRRPVRGRQRGAGPGRRAELRALDRGIRLRHLPGPRSDQRPRGRGRDQPADRHHRQRHHPAGHRGLLRPAGRRGHLVRARSQPDPAALRRGRQPRRQRGGRGLPAGRHHLHLVPARIGGIQNAQGPNIYETSTVTRQIYEIRAVVRSGNSGGPLLSPQGTVDGVVFAAAVGVSDTGFALTAAEVSADASAGAQLTSAVSTGACD